MHRRSLTLITLLLALAVPLSASQFIEVPFDQVAREAKYVVRGVVGPTWTGWNDAHDLIYTYATVRVTRYFGDATGPETLVIREVGGTVDGYTQEAIGFPEIRSGEDVVLMLSPWEDNASDLRIHAYNQGKYLVRQRGAKEVLIADPRTQGSQRLGGGERLTPQTEGAGESIGLTIEEFANMVDDARAGGSPTLDPKRIRE